MPVDPNIRAMMDAIDDHAPNIGSGGYTLLANRLKDLADCIDEKETCARRTLARDMIVEKAACIGVLAVYPYTHDPEFMQGVVRAKALELQEYTTGCAAVLGSEWKQQLAETVLENRSPELFLRLRLGMLSLLVARSGFLHPIVERLAALKVTPEMLFAKELNAPIPEEDEGYGPTARDLLQYEPRLLRWMLGRAPLSPWPVLRDTRRECERRLIRHANAKGGDDPLINAPCECPRCEGLSIPTMEDPHFSLGPSECDSDDEGYESPSPSPSPSPPPPPPPPRPPTRVQRTHATRSRDAARPYQSRARS